MTVALILACSCVPIAVSERDGIVACATCGRPLGARRASRVPPAVAFRHHGPRVAVLRARGATHAREMAQRTINGAHLGWTYLAEELAKVPEAEAPPAPPSGLRLILGGGGTDE